MTDPLLHSFVASAFENDDAAETGRIHHPRSEARASWSPGIGGPNSHYSRVRSY